MFESGESPSMIGPDLIGHRLAALDPRFALAGMQYSRIAKSLTPSINQKLFGIAARLAQQEQRNPSVSILQLQTRVKTAVLSSFQSDVLRSTSGTTAGLDIDELAMIVMMGVGSDMDNDLRDIMGNVRAMTASNARIRAMTAEAQGQQSLLRDAVASCSTKLIRHK
jgi:hypothetical protein